jgi:4-hydroxythreonine-4-phosphate dehydrogenase
MIIGHQKGINTKMRQYRNFGMPNPEGYRKALRMMKMAEKFNIPVVTLIDTPGAFPGIEAEDRGQAEAIARNLYEMAQLTVPILCYVIGEGASGGALGIGVGDKTFMLQNTWFTVISPESCSSILWRSWEHKEKAAEALKSGLIHGLVTAPIHKKNIQTASFNFSGHTPYLKQLFGGKDVAMLMIAENMRIGLLTEHVPVKDISQFITKESILSKLQVINQSLKKDFLITKPKIAVLGLNPHSGDEGLIGKEEIEIIKPAIKEAKQKDIFCFGPYSADAFFARGQYEKFDAVLALYHDQGLIPFKSLSLGEGVNFTAGLNAVRTSPDHGTAFDIAGKGLADETSTRQALFSCIDILHNRNEYSNQRANPLRKLSKSVVANAIDEKINED